MSEHDSEQELQRYLDGDSDISRDYHRQAREKTPEHLDDAILAASRRGVGSRPQHPSSPFGATWRVSFSMAAVLLISVILVFSLQDQIGEVRLDEPVHVSSDDTAAVIPESGPVVRSENAATVDSAASYRTSADKGAVSGTVQPEAAITKDQMIEDKVSSSLEELSPVPAEPAPIARDETLSMDEDAIVGRAMKKEKPVMADAPATRMRRSEAIESLIEERVSTLEDEIADLRQNREALEKEKAELEQDMKQVEARRDVLERKAATLADKADLSEEIHGTRAQVAWLTHIRQLQEDELYGLARENLADFRKEYPDYAEAELLRIFPQDFIRPGSVP